MSDHESRVPAADALPIQCEATLGLRVARVTVGPLYRVLFRPQRFGLKRILDDRPYVLAAIT